MSPKKRMKGESMTGSSWATACAIPKASFCSTYEISSPSREPSPRKAMTSSLRCPITTTTRFTPSRAISSR